MESNKKQSTALILCVFGGFFGVHQFYVGKFKKGLVYLLTGGLFFIGWIVDIIMILLGNFCDSNGRPLIKDVFSRNNQRIGYNFRRTIHNHLVPQISPQNYDSMEGHQFEYFCADVIRRNGFGNVEVTQGSGDHGIDILAEKDGIAYAIQCKCYSSNIGNAAVQQAYTGKGFYQKDIAVVLTNRYFTAQAKEEAQALGVKLWDRDKLNDMISKI